MSTKLDNLNEITSLVSTKEKMNEGVLGMIKQFKAWSVLKPFASAKTQGIGLMQVLTDLILQRLGGISVNVAQKTGLSEMDDNTDYRLMNNEFVNWRGLLSFAKQFVRCAKEKGDNNGGVKCFVVDDTDLPKTGKTIECISKIFSHRLHGYILGIKLLVLSYCDTKSHIACDCSLHRESKKNGYGLTAKETKEQFHKHRSENSYGAQRYAELDAEKPSIVLSMLKRACRHGMLASYVLMDSWFITDGMIKGIRKIRKGMMHVIGICKMDKRKFEVGGKEMNSQTITKMNEVKKDKVHTSRKFHSDYMIVNALYKGVSVRLFYIKYKHATSWTLLLTTDVSLSFAKAMELYQIRWSIEVMFKECKQYLRLGKAQNTDFDGQVADVTLALLTHTILTLKKRFHSYETMGVLFREIQSKLLEATIYERIYKLFLKLVAELLEYFGTDVNETIGRIINDDKTSKRVLVMLEAVNQLDTEERESENVV
ncbi:hypothetical protein FACS1894195_0230 [Bacteroidia bacterium]|nr:hypothetical protein FACS1894195_0230 [Bacteroidia bacterium]